MTQRLSRRSERLRPLRGLTQQHPRAVDQVLLVAVPWGGVRSGVEVVLGKHAGQVLRHIRLGTEVAGHRQMPRLAITAGQRVVADLADDRLHEPVLPTLGAARPHPRRQDLLTYQGVQQTVEVRPDGEGSQPRAAEAHAEHRRVLHESAFARGQRVKSPGHQRLQAGRSAYGEQVQGAAWIGDDVRTAPRHHRITVDESPHRLHRVQRHALRPLHQAGPGSRRQVGNQSVHQNPHGRLAERLEMHRRRPATRADPGPALAQFGARQAENEQRELCRLQRVVEIVEQSLVSVLEILDEQDQRVLSFANSVQEDRPRGEQVLAGELPQFGA